MHRFALVLALAALILTVPARIPAAQPTLLFGAGLSLTGRDAREGRLTQQGYEIWKAYANAHGGIPVGKERYLVEIKYYDDETNPQTAVRLAERLIDQDHVSFLLGPYGTASTFSASAVSERRHVPMVVTNGPASAVFDRGFRYIFGVQTPAKRYLEGIVAMALSMKPAPKTLAVASANLAFPIEVGQGAADYAQAHGMQIVYNQKFPAAASDVSPVVAQIKAANPDVVLIAGYLQDSLLFQKGFKEQNVNARIFGYSVGPDTPDFREALGRDANFVFGGTQWTPTMTYKGRSGFYATAPEYAKAFQKTFGI
ncbi:MAG: amino acid ABC transporter substrate-binding protein, partial [Candidatus Eremiobacteraeota bacterium]|nr:amino acid ABC transporter substrate-binding protein [Candidatus Eremiobacteraeota bacterium]